MATQETQSWAFFDGPIAKAIVATVAIGGALVGYVTASGTRLRAITNVANTYNFHGWKFWLVLKLPAYTHAIYSFLMIIIGAFELFNLSHEYYFPDAKLPTFATLILSLAIFVNSYFWVLFLLSCLFLVAFYTKAAEILLNRAIGLVPQWRRTREWANASWQIQNDFKDAPIVALYPPRLTRLASDIIGELVVAPRSPRLALRPTNLGNESAANILYFGHVIEQYCARTLNRSFAWTGFYQALADRAGMPDAPFLPTNIRARGPSGQIFQIFLEANQFLAQTEQIPNDPGLEDEIQKAFLILNSDWVGDATNMSRGFFGTDYGRVLKRSTCILTTEGMRRQLAKLFIIWSIKPRASHPAIFRIPFNTKMFLRFLDDEVLIVPGARLDIASENTQICFENTENEMMDAAFRLLNSTHDGVRVAWREAEIADVVSRNLNWIWWINYRIDTQFYASSQGHVSPSWTVSGNEIVRINP